MYVLTLRLPSRDEQILTMCSMEQDIKTTLWDDTSPQIRYAGDWAAGTTQLGKLVNATAQSVASYTAKDR